MLRLGCLHATSSEQMACEWSVSQAVGSHVIQGGAQRQELLTTLVNLCAVRWCEVQIDIVVAVAEGLTVY